MNIDEQLRGTLRRHAEEAPSGVGLLDGVRARTRRHERRRRFEMAGMATMVAVSAAVSAPYLLGPGRHAPVVVGSGPPASTTTSAPPAPTGGSTWASTVALVAGPAPSVTFPLTPQWTPPGVGELTAGRSENAVRLVYVGGSAGLMAFVSAQLGEAPWPPVTTTPITVGSAPATMATGTDADNAAAVRITWRLPDHRWVDLQAVGLTSQQVRHFADSLRRQPLTPPLPFTLALAPRDYVVAFQEIDGPSEFHYCLAPPAGLTDTEAYVCVGQSAQADPVTGGRPVRVGADDGVITTSDGLIRLTVHRPQFEFFVLERVHGALSEADLIRFAAGVTRQP